MVAAGLDRRAVSLTPFSPSLPSSPHMFARIQWLKNLYTADDVKDQIYKLARKGLTPSKIGA